MNKIKRSVMRVDRSPLNPMQWCLRLDCGHEVWVTAKSRPKRPTLACDKCASVPSPVAGEEETR